ncbi:hypothetical protein SDC9_116592 [bioreactor metagenome]|uniref:Uncharacterized protein n=1 Tax=bioreactor metagenome TaxID=1076179 RepID=A0A645C6R4_9ZZZZ
MGADPGERAQRDDDEQRHRPDHQFEAGGVVPFGIVMRFGVGLAVFPGEQQRQDDHGNNDDEHQQRGRDHQLSLLGSDIACGVEHDGLAAAREEGCQSCRAQPYGPAGFLGFRHAWNGQKRAHQGLSPEC